MGTSLRPCVECGVEIYYGPTPTQRHWHICAHHESLYPPRFAQVCDGCGIFPIRCPGALLHPLDLGFYCGVDVSSAVCMQLVRTPDDR